MTASESHFRRQYFYREDVERSLNRLRRYLAVLQKTEALVEKHHGRLYGGRGYKVRRIDVEIMRVRGTIAYLEKKLPVPVGSGEY